MSYYGNGSTKPKNPSSNISKSSHINYDENDSPAVSVLEKVTDGMVCLKVEADIMAYILYCHYDEFARIQQTYEVAITWSGKDNNVIICTPTRSDASQLLHLATQQFLSFYHHIASNLVASPLSSHVTNITLHQYHKATYDVKKLHSKAMIKEVKTTGRIVLYCPATDVADARRTFLTSLRDDDSSESLGGDSIGLSSEELYESSSPSFGEGNQRNILKKTRHTKHADHCQQDVIPRNRASVSEDYPSHSYTKPNHYPTLPIKSASAFSQSNYHQSARMKINGTYLKEENGNSPDRRDVTIRHKMSAETASSNGSSGYGSHSGTMNRHYSQYATMNDRPSASGNFENTILPAIAPRDKLQRTSSDPPLPQASNSLTEKRSQSPDYSHFYYDDIQHSGVVSPPRAARRPNTQESLLNSQKGSYLYHHDGTSKGSTGLPNPHEDRFASVLKWNTSVKRKNGNTESPLTRYHSPPAALLKKPSFIPKIKSPFRFLQHHKKYFEVTTPTGLVIEVHEGDVTDSGCDAIVNVTNEHLHVTGELAWAVAKHGSFEIPKHTKFHVAMHGPVMESKVVVTPSVGLPSANIIHAVAPKWSGNDMKRSKKLLYNTYKNIFNVSNVQLKAKSLALPVIGLQNTGNPGDSFPFHIATEVMYQALIAFLKLGSTTLRHIRYIDNDPDHVNLIVTSIKPKIENVTYDARFLIQHQPQRNMTSVSSTATICGDNHRSEHGSPPLMMSPVYDVRDAYCNSRTLPNVNARANTFKRQ